MNELTKPLAGLLDEPGSSSGSRPESIRGTPYEVETTAVIESGIFDVGEVLGISFQPEFEGTPPNGGQLIAFQQQRGVNCFKVSAAGHLPWPYTPDGQMGAKAIGSRTASPGSRGDSVLLVSAE